MPEQVPLPLNGSNDGPPSERAPKDLANARYQGVVFHGKQGSIRVRGQTVDGGWMALRCTSAGKDLSPPQAVYSMAGWGWIGR